MSEVKAFLRCVRAYLEGTVGQRLSLFIWFQNLPPGDCSPGVPHVYMVSEPT